MCNAIAMQDAMAGFSIPFPIQPMSEISDAEYEAKRYYCGLPSIPPLVCRTGVPYKRPTGPEAYNIKKEARPVFDSAIADAWDTLSPQVIEYLDSIDVMWTTIDIVCFNEVEKDPGPPVLWIGIKPGSLSYEVAKVVAVGCKELLNEFELTDVEVEFRESLFTRSASFGPQLLEYVPSYQYDVTDDVRSPLTPALGLKIAAQATPHIEGTGALYIRESTNSKRIFILTARHVVFPPNTGSNELYTGRKVGQPYHHVLLLGSKAFQDLLKCIMIEISNHDLRVKRYKNWLVEVTKQLALDEENDIAQIKKEQREYEGRLQEAKEAIDPLNEFHTKIAKHWSLENLRILGHIAYSPPISVRSTGTKCFTEDWALIELDNNKINWETFKGNVVDLGIKISMDNFARKMDSHAFADVRFWYDGLFPLQGITKEDDLHHPTTLDANGDPCFLVTKNSTRTGVTVGHTSSIMSFIREYFPDGNHQTSMALAIYPYGHKNGAFSTPGDSGAIITDEMHHIVGLITGGSGSQRGFDVTYATPFYWLWDECIKKQFPNACLY